MDEQSVVNEPIEEQEIIVTEEEEDDFDYGPPRGTVAFITLMLIAYIIYYAIHYVEIFILRGA